MKAAPAKTEAPAAKARGRPPASPKPAGKSPPPAAERKEKNRGERPAGRAQLQAKRGCIGQMQTPAELVPIPERGVKASEGFGRLRKASESFGRLRKASQSSQKFRNNLAKILQTAAKLRKLWGKIANKSQNVDEKIEIKATFHFLHNPFHIT